MGVIDPGHQHREYQDDTTRAQWFVGIDWGSQTHQVCVLNCNRHLVGERAVDQGGASLTPAGDLVKRPGRRAP